MYLREVVKRAPHLISEGDQGPGSRDRTPPDMEKIQWRKVETKDDCVATIPKSWSLGQATPLNQRRQMEGKTMNDPCSLEKRPCSSPGVQTGVAGFRVVAHPCPVRSASDQATPPPLPDLRMLGWDAGIPKGLTGRQQCPPHRSQRGACFSPSLLSKITYTIFLKKCVIPE